MAAKATIQEERQERRGSPEFRLRAQQGYSVLRKMITSHGSSEIGDDLKNMPMIEDVMRQKPELVGALLKSAWQLRSNEKLAEFFNSAVTPEKVVDGQDESILPCDRTYESTLQSHLFGTVRLYMKQKENDWVQRRVSRPESLDKEAVGGFGNFFRKLFGMKPIVNENVVRESYPSRGLYEILKPYLLHADQFKYVTAYAGLSAKGASIIGDIFENLRSSAALKVACTLSPDALLSARGCARAYAESGIFAEVLEEEKEVARKRTPQEMRRDSEIALRIKQDTAVIFADILNNHIESLDFVKRHKAGAEAVVRALAPLYQEETWSVLAEDGAVENVINCPPTVAKELGKDARYIDVKVSKYITQMHYPDIGRDIIAIFRKELNEENFRRSLQDEAAIKVWETVPGTFNNRFKYQHDAKAGVKEIKNFKDLLGEAKPIVADMRNALGLEKPER
ncbi:MAG: hypothetical protein RLN84_14015 [Rhodospirillaceae bacterium]